MSCPCSPAARDTADHKAFVLMFDTVWDAYKTGPKAHQTVRACWHVASFRFPRLQTYPLTQTEAWHLLWCARLRGVPDAVAMLLGWAQLGPWAPGTLGQILVDFHPPGDATVPAWVEANEISDPLRRTKLDECC